LKGKWLTLGNYGIIIFGDEGHEMRLTQFPLRSFQNILSLASHVFPSFPNLMILNSNQNRSNEFGKQEGQGLREICQAVFERVCVSPESST
jgi:hypothetical protein